MKIWYRIWNGKIKSWIKEEDGYYMLDDIWWIKYGGNKRASIKRALKNSQCFISHRTNHIVYSPSTIYSILIKSNLLEERLEKFKRMMIKVEENILEELDNL